MKGFQRFGALQEPGWYNEPVTGALDKIYRNMSTVMPSSVFNGYGRRLSRYFRPLRAAAGTQVRSRGMLAVWAGLCAHWEAMGKLL